MKNIAVVSSIVVTLVIGIGGLAGAEPVKPVLHEEAGRLVDQLTDQFRGLGAQLEEHMRHGRGMLGPGMGPGGPGLSPTERPLITMMLHHRSDLGLTDEQVGRLEALRGDFAREAIRRDAEIRIAELDLAALLEGDPVDVAKAEAKIREVAQLRADLRVARLRTIEQGKAVLTAEQKARLQSLLGGGMHGPRRSAASGTRL